MRLIQYQLQNSLINIKQIKKTVDHKWEENEDPQLGNWHYELLDMELRLKDMIKNIDKLEEHFQKRGIKE